MLIIFAGRMITLIHVGAGNTSYEKYNRLQRLVMAAFKAGAGHGATTKHGIFDRMYNVSKVIEDSDLTNCGRGSNLSSSGKVINDATVVLRGDDGLVRFFCLTGVNKYANPIGRCLNFLVVEELEAGNSSIGVTGSCALVDNDVNYFAIEENCLFDDGFGKQVVSKDRRLQYEKWDSQRTQNAQGSVEVADTIGICINSGQETIAGVCSGGNLLKPDGRIGCAAVYGSGSYIMSSDSLPFFEASDTVFVISLLASGNGEDIIAMDLCRFCCLYLLTALQMPGSFLESELLVKAITRALANVSLQATHHTNYQQTLLYVGVVGTVKEIDSSTGAALSTTLIYAHSTETFVFAAQNQPLAGKKHLEFVFSRNKTVGSFAHGVIRI